MLSLYLSIEYSHYSQSRAQLNLGCALICGLCITIYIHHFDSMPGQCLSLLDSLINGMTYSPQLQMKDLYFSIAQISIAWPPFTVMWKHYSGSHWVIIAVQIVSPAHPDFCYNFGRLHSYSVVHISPGCSFVIQDDCVRDWSFAWSSPHHAVSCQAIFGWFLESAAFQCSGRGLFW